MKQKKKNLLLYFLFIVITITIIIISYSFYLYEKKIIENKAKEELDIISSYKINQINNINSKIISNSELIYNSKYFLRAIIGTINNDTMLRRLTIDRLSIIKKEYSLNETIITNSNKELIFCENKNTRLDIKTINHIDTSFIFKKIVLSEFIKSDSGIYYDVITPIISNDSVIGSLIYRANIDSLNLIINYKLSKTLSLKSYFGFLENNSIKLLNAEGNIDENFHLNQYENKNYYTHVNKLQHNNNYLITVIDKKEIYNELFEKSIYLLLIVASLISIFLIVLILIINYRKKIIYKDLWQESLEYKTTLKSIGDGVITTDNQGNIKFLNKIAEQITEWKFNDALNKPLEEIFKIINEETREKVENPVKKVLETGKIIGLANHTILITKSGREIPIADSGAPILDENNEIIGVVLVFRNQSEEREYQKEILYNKERYKSLLNANPDLLFVFNRDGLIIDFKADNYSNLYLSPDNFLNKNILDCMPYEIAISTIERLNILFDTNEIQTYKYSLKIGNEIKYFESRLSKSTNNNAIAIVRDITKPFEQEQKLKDIIDNTTNMFYYHTTEHVLTYVSPQSYKFLGCSPEVAKRRWTEFVTDNPINELGFEKTVKAIETGLTQGPYELELRKLNGEIIWVEVNENPIFENNKVIGIVGALTDITQQKYITDNLIKSEEKYRRLHESMREAYAMVSMDGIIIECNKAFQLMVGYNEEEIKKLTYMDLTPANWHDYEKEIVEKQILINGYSELYEKEYIHKNGRIFPVELHTFLLKDENNNPAAMWAIVRDISERKKIQSDLILATEKAIESDKLKSAFLANMSHEIRTPMNAILGFANLLEDDTIDNTDKKYYLKLINSSGNRLLHLINDIIDISKIEAKQLKIFKSNFNVDDLLIKIFRTFKESSIYKSKKELNLNINNSDLNNCILYSDESRIQQIIDNLIHNAIKFTEKGTIEFGYKITDDNNFIKFYVCDTGRGIPINKIDIVFDRFIQIDDKDYREGTGLGLSISKGLTELMGGKIWVESSESGSCFQFTIPNIQKDIVNETIKSNTDKSLNLENKTIIIAEDDKFSYEYLYEILKNTKANIIHVNNGNDLMNMLEIKQPDLLLLDINMPEKNGNECLKEIKEKEYNFKIIIQTAYAMQDEKEIFLNAGCDGYIAKPIKKLELYNIINNVFSK